MATRESVFVCRFTSARGARTAHVRAWDEREAALLFRGELAEEEREPGVIEVVGRAPGQRLETRFEPAARG